MRSELQLLYPSAQGEALTVQMHINAACSVDEEPAQIVAASFTDTKQSGGTAGGMLPWYEPQPGRELAATRKL